MMTTQDRNSYHNALREAEYEAAWTMVAAFAVTVVFWGAIFFTHESILVLLGLPLWFWVSCIGGYFFSIAVVLLLVKRFKHVDFDRVTDNPQEGEAP